MKVTSPTSASEPSTVNAGRRSSWPCRTRFLREQSKNPFSYGNYLYAPLYEGSLSAVSTSLNPRLTFDCDAAIAHTLMLDARVGPSREASGIPAISIESSPVQSGPVALEEGPNSKAHL